ncbi:MAG: hypothetical protein JXR03_03020 [Cyclobacteriaceae bacterium]
MDLFSKIFSKKELVEGGACPNCWGEQEYDNIVRDMIEDKQVAVNNHESRHSFIQDFVVNHVDGIHLQKGDGGLQCPRCKRKI